MSCINRSVPQADIINSRASGNSNLFRRAGALISAKRTGFDPARLRDRHLPPFHRRQMIVIIVTLFYSCTKKSFREIHHAEMAHITGRQRYRPAGLCCLQRPTGRAGAELSATRAQHCPVPKTGGSAGAGSPRRRNRRLPGQRHATRTVFASISNAIIQAAASRAPNLIPPMRAR